MKNILRTIIFVGFGIVLFASAAAARGTGHPGGGGMGRHGGGIGGGGMGGMGMGGGMDGMGGHAR